ncbi:MAG: hypothetical protein IPM88_20830 [Nitrospira sp.]|nr:hypothetical protein [Nitrospira sp.]
MSNWGAIVAEVASRSNGTERFRTSIRNRVAQGARALEFLGESATALGLLGGVARSHALAQLPE